MNTDDRVAMEKLLRAAGLSRIHCLRCNRVWAWDGKENSCRFCHLKANTPTNYHRNFLIIP